MKYNRAYEMFNDMMEFAVAHGMTSYQSDLIHDAVWLQKVEDAKTPATLIWIVKSSGCGTWMWDMVGGEIPSTLLDAAGAKVEITYDGTGWTFNEQ